MLMYRNNLAPKENVRYWVFTVRRCSLTEVLLYIDINVFINGLEVVIQVHLHFFATIGAKRFTKHFIHVSGG